MVKSAVRRLKVTVKMSFIYSPTMYDIRIFLIFVANIDRNENNYCCIRVSF